MGAAESKSLQNNVTMDDFEVEEHPLRKEIDDLKALVVRLKEELEEGNAERVELMRKLNERE